jgi:sulfide:quinone oxidoreductase
MSNQPFRVVIAGGGVAALEALLCLAQAGLDHIELTLIAPEQSLSYRPASTAQPFVLHPEHSLRLDSIAGDVGAHLVHDAVARVDDAGQRLLTRDGDLIAFDALLLAVGARWSHGLKHGLAWMRDESSTREWANLLRDLEHGAVERLAFVVPARAGWPVDAYELALIASAASRDAGRSPRIDLLTAEPAPLAALGREAGEAVGAALEAAAIRLLAGVEVRDRGSADGPGPITLELGSGEHLAFDRVVSVPVATGWVVGGVPHDEHGMLPVGRDGRVRGTRRVWAAGDVTTLSVKHGLLAVGQAEAAARAIAADAGAVVGDEAWEPRLRGILSPPERALSQSVWVREGEPLTHCLWWPPGRVTGPRLAPYIARRDPTLHLDFAWHPHGLPLDIPIAGLDAGTADSQAAPAWPSESAQLQDAGQREILAMRRANRAAWALERELEEELKQFELHERAVVAELRRAGYLQSGAPIGPARRGA